MSSDNHEIFRALGELSSDVKHVLTTVARTGRETDQLRVDTATKFKEQDTRISSLEKFYIRVAAYASIAIPVALIFIKWGIPFVMEAVVG